MKIIDLHFHNCEKTIASFLLETSAGPVLFETGPYSTFDNLSAGLEEHGYTVGDIKHVFITHIHLDHAGAAWALASEGATVYLHPFGKKHMADPSRLMGSARRIYGDMMDRLWGAMNEIEESQLHTVEHGDEIVVGKHTIKAWHTPGHAVHHVAWQVDTALICGDVAGVKIEDGPVVPPCPPPDINLEIWRESIALIRGLGLESLYLTHWGPITAIDEHLDSLDAILSDWAQWILERWQSGESVELMTPAFQKYTSDQLK